jgi:hypothetical protein
MISLRTIDETQKFPLLKIYPLHSQPFLKRENLIKQEKNKTQAFTLKNLLSKEECEEIMKTTTEKKFNDLKKQYLEETRDSSRLCVLDSELSTLLWKRINKIIRKDHLEMNFSPIGFNTSGFWEPCRVNECFRISKYESPSKGFASHFDNQFTTSFDEKSVFSLIIYLNEEFKGGETVIYEENLLNVDKEIVSETFEGITISKEIEMNGGISSYKKHVIEPEIGKGVIFNHQLLHSGDPLLGGTKYILRTDIVFQKKLCLNSIFHYKLFNRCTELFQNAQQEELQQNKEKSNELYEKSLSIRRYVTKHEKNEKMDSLVELEDCWMIIFSFISIENQTSVSLACKTIQSYFQSYKDQFWFKIKNKHFPKEPKQEFNQKFCLEMSKLFIPKVARTTNGFIFTYDEDEKGTSPFQFFELNKEACLRVVAMYTYALFGSNHGDDFIAEYNPETQLVKQCPLKWLLICAFYELPCNGSYFHLHYSNEKDIRIHFNETMQNMIKKKEAKKFNFQKIERIELQGIETVEPLFESLVDQFYIQKNYPRNEFQNNIQVVKHIQNPEQYEKMDFQWKTGFSEIEYKCGKDVKRKCKCGDKYNSYDGVDFFLRFNNLICDFSKNQLHVLDYDPKVDLDVSQRFQNEKDCEKYIAMLGDLKLKGFHHAGCPCGPSDMTVISSINTFGIKFQKTMRINKIEIVVHLDMYGDFSGIVSCVYHAINSF